MVKKKKTIFLCVSIYYNIYIYNINNINIKHKPYMMVNKYF